MKELYIFGAGASHASCGTPLGKNLVWNYFEDTSTLYEIGNNGGPASRDLEAKKKEYELFGDFLKSIIQIFPGMKNYYEHWIKCMSEAMMFNPEIEKSHYIDEVMEVLCKKGDEENISLIKKLTVEHITKTTDEGQNPLYKKFVQYLKDKRQGEVTIISFNYDCLLQDDFQNKIGFDYLITFDAVKAGRLIDKNVSFPLIKLNGSLDWAIDKFTKKVTLASPYVTRNTYSFKTQFEPYIFLPHQQKDAFIKVLWERARDEIKAATKIIIIGYSFPAYDKDVIKLFNENINATTKIEVIDFYNDYDGLKDRREKEIERRYKQLFPQISRISVSLDGFKGFIDRGLV